MNNNKIDFNKSNLQIAPNTSFPSAHSSFSLSGPGNSSHSNNNNNNRNNDNQNNFHSDSRCSSPQSFVSNSSSPSPPATPPVTPYSSNFSPSMSSLSMDDTSHTISIASLNVRGFASNVSKFDAVIDDLFNKDLSIIGLQETHITEQSANILFKNKCAIRSDIYPYRAY